MTPPKTTTIYSFLLVSVLLLFFIKSCTGFFFFFSRSSSSSSCKGHYYQLNNSNNKNKISPLQLLANDNNNNNNADNNNNNADKSKLEFEIISSISDIDADHWNSCNFESPFLEYSWLQCLEESGCASAQTGWQTQYVACYHHHHHANSTTTSMPIAYVPMYVKSHSMGEFIFDNAWADAAYRSGIEYYPKLLVGVPFTPATGNRILISPLFKNNEEDLIKQIGDFLKYVSRANNISSVHINFCLDKEATILSKSIDESLNDDNNANGNPLKMLLLNSKSGDDWARRSSVQYHWSNLNPKTVLPYQDFDDYLSCFKSKKRITIKRERRRVLEEEGVSVKVVAGRDILKYDGLVERMYEIYVSTIDKMYYGRQYLTLEFFQKIAASDFIDNLCFVCATKKDNDAFQAEDVFAGTVNIVKNGIFYGRYWGCLQHTEIKNLHFEVCYWSAIEYCIKKGLVRMEPGAGGGDYKFTRGFDPSIIHSVHYITHPGFRAGVREFLHTEMMHNEEVTNILKLNSKVGSKAANNVEDVDAKT